MKKVYKREVYFKISTISTEWRLTNRFAKYLYLDEAEAEAECGFIEYTNFDDLLKMAKTTSLIPNCEVEESFFKKRPIVTLHAEHLEEYSITEKNFKPVEFFFCFPEIKNPSIIDLMEKLSSDDFLEYLKDRNINFTIDR